jgi:Na+/melibiose symporter-like transporter
LLSLISLRAPFFTYALSLFIAGVIASVYLKNNEVLNRAKNSHEKVETFTVKMAWRFPAYRMALAMAFIFAWCSSRLRASILPIFVVENLHSTTAMVGYGLTLSALVQGSILLRAGRLSDQRGRRYVSRIGSSIVLIGVLLLAITNRPGFISWLWRFSVLVVHSSPPFRPALLVTS